MILNSIKGILLQGGVNHPVYVDELPYGVVNCVALMLTPSQPPNTVIPYFFQLVDAWVRFERTDEAYSALISVRDILHQKKAYQMEDYYIYLSNAVSSIDSVGRDSNGNKLLKLTFRFIYRDILLVS